MSAELDLRALRYFVTAAGCRSYTLAAAHLRVSQPAITRQVQSIEKSLGVRLFRPQGRSMVLTEAGEVLFARARDIIDRIAEAGAVTRGASSEPTGRLAIGSPPATGEILLPSVLASYRLKFPHVFIHVVSAHTADLARLLVEGKLDVALIFNSVSHTELDTQFLQKVELGLVAPPSGVLRHDPVGPRTSICLKEAASLPQIYPSAVQSLRPAVDNACRLIGVKPNVAMESDSLSLSKALVKRGAGYMFLGRFGVLAELRTHELRYLRLEPPGIDWSLLMATRRGKTQSLAVRMMMRELSERGGAVELAPTATAVRP